MSIILYEKNGDYVECKLCPHRCQLKAGESGKCLARRNDGDAIFLCNYGELVSVAINPIEKKPFKMFLEGTKTLSIGGVGCSLSCNFCENYKISQPSKISKNKKFLPDNLVNIAHEKHCKSICMTFNEPTISFEYLIDVAKACHDNDLKFILKTNAYVNKEPWVEICSVTDAMNIDWKGAGRLYQDITGAIEYVTEDRIAEAFHSGVHVEVSIPVYFYTGDEMLCLSDFVYFLANLNDEIACHIDVIHSSFNYNRTITKNDLVYENVFNILHQNMSNVFVE